MHRASILTTTLFLVVAVTSCSGTAQLPATSQGRQGAALAVCRNAVIQQLKGLPATFSHETSLSTNYGFNFSGMVSTHGASKHYACSVDENGANNWVAASVSIP
jgi:hypothetical protein